MNVPAGQVAVVYKQYVHGKELQSCSSKEVPSFVDGQIVGENLHLLAPGEQMELMTLVIRPHGDSTWEFFNLRNVGGQAVRGPVLRVIADREVNPPTPPPQFCLLYPASPWYEG